MNRTLSALAGIGRCTVVRGCKASARYSVVPRSLVDLFWHSYPHSGSLERQEQHDHPAGERIACPPEFVTLNHP